MAKRNAGAGSLREMQAQKVAAGGRGFRCPACGCGVWTDEDGRPNWVVGRTEKRPGLVQRVRICGHCGYRLSTVELPRARVRRRGKS